MAELTAYDAHRLRFSYRATTDHRLETVSRLLVPQGGSWGNALVTRQLENVWGAQSGATWIPDQQNEGPAPGPTQVRVHSYSYTPAQTNPPQPARLDWTDPHGVVHKFTLTGSGSPATWHVATYTRTPTPGDVSGFGAQTWKFEWDGCACGRLAAVELPDGRRREWSYDGEGRGLVTEIRQKTSATDTNPRTWRMTYLPWGAVNATGLVWRKSSRMTQFTDENGTPWTFGYGWNPTLKRLDTTMTIAGGLNLTWNLSEDQFGRPIRLEEPIHTTHAGSGSARVKTEWSYFGSGLGVGLVQQIRHFRPQATTTEDFTYDALGHLATYKDERNATTTYTMDFEGNVATVLLPPVTSGKPNVGPISGVTLSLDYGVFGEVVRAKRVAKDVDGNSYPGGFTVSEAAANTFGEIVTTRTDGRKLDTGAPQWLKTIRGYDELGRLVSLTLPGNRLRKFLIDDYDMVQEIRYRPQANNSNEATWPKRRILYTTEGKPTHRFDRSGFVKEYQYDLHGRVKSISYAGGQREFRVVWPAVGSVQRPERVELWVNNVKVAERSWTYDALGRTHTAQLKDVASGATHTATIGWNGLRYVASVADNNGRSKTYAYDDAGQIEWLEDSLDLPGNHRNRTQVTRDPFGQVGALERKIWQETPGSGGGSSWSMSTYKMVYDYDEWGRVRRVGRFGKAGTEQAERLYARDTLGRLTWFRDSDGRVLTRLFDAIGRERVTTRIPEATGGGSTVVTKQDFLDAPGNEGTSGYGDGLDANALGLVVTRTDTRNLETNYLFDMLGQLVERRLPGFSTAAPAHRWTYRRDGESRINEWKDGNGHEVHVDRDMLQRPIRRWVNPVGSSQLSLATAWEEWAYDDAAFRVTRRTRSDAWYVGQGTNANWLINEVRDYDGLGRLFTEDFGFGDDGAHQSITTKRLTHGYAIPGTGTEDTGFRRSLTLASGWNFDFTPDGAGKLAKIGLQGPGDAAAFDSAKYFYEGGRVATRQSRITGSGKWFQTDYGTDSLGYLSSLKTTFDPGGSANNVLFDLEQASDKEGNVRHKKYDKMRLSGGSWQPTPSTGDWFGLDGHGRLSDAQLGVGFTGGTPNPGTFDKRIQYGLDNTQNRSSVTTTYGNQAPITTPYTLESTSNRYTDAGWGPLLYDGNGNLIWDGFRFYVYDYLDRLCEVWEWEATAAANAGGGGARYKSASLSRKRRTKPLVLSKRDVRTVLARLRRKGYAKRARTKDGLKQLNKQLARDAAAAKKKSGSGSTAAATAGFALVAFYGYDSIGRRVLRTTTANTEGVRWMTWDGWRMASEWEADGNPGFTAQRVLLDGRGIDEHVGFATNDGAGWSRHVYVQDSLGHVMQSVAPSGAREESYEYDPYGNRTTWTWSAGQASQLAGGGSQIGSDWGYTGRRHDGETGLLYFRTRYQDSTMGRFSSVDRIGVWGDLGNWGNGYAYVGNREATYTDPGGLGPFAGGPLTGGGGGGGANVLIDPGGQGGGNAKKKCYKLRIYVNQPGKGGDKDILELPMDAGHSSVGLSDGTTETDYGLYGNVARGEGSSAGASSSASGEGASSSRSSSGGPSRGSSEKSASHGSAGASGAAGSSSPVPFINETSNGQIRVDANPGATADVTAEFDLTAAEFKNLEKFIKGEIDDYASGKKKYDLRGRAKRGENCSSWVLVVLSQVKKNTAAGIRAASAGDFAGFKVDVAPGPEGEALVAAKLGKRKGGGK